MQMHLNVHSLPLIALPDMPGRVLINVTIDDTSFEELAFLMQGGQRMLLTQETCETLIEALLCNKAIELRVGRYKSVLVPADFQIAFNKLCKLKTY